MALDIKPLVLDEAPRGAVSDVSSDAGKLQGSVQQWGREVTNAIRTMSTALQKLQQASVPTPTPTPAASSVQQVIAAAGANGWTPVFALVTVTASVVVLQLSAWTGGTGAAPASGMYVGPAGFVTMPFAATNLLGPSSATGALTFQYIFSAAIAAPPAAGSVLFDSATFGSITHLHINDLDRNGVDISATLAEVAAGSVLSVFQEGGSSLFATFIVTAITVNVGYYSFTVTPLSGQVLQDNQPAGFAFTGGSTGGPPTGPAGGDLSGTYPNPAVAAGVKAAIAATAEAASYPGLGLIPPSSASGKINWTKLYFVEDYANIQTAFNASAAANGLLVLPPGNTALPAGGLVLPAGVTGGVGIRGAGKNVTFLTQANAGRGVNLIPNVGTPANTFFHIRDFTVVATNAACTDAMVVDFGTGAGTGAGGTSSSMENINIVESGGGLWTSSGFYLRNCWSWQLSGLSGLGNYTPGAGGSFNSGFFIWIDSCVDMIFRSVTAQSWKKGVYMPLGTNTLAGTDGSSQGVVFNGLALTFMSNLLDLFLGVNQGVWISNFVLDSGNTGLDIPNNLPVQLVGPNPPGGANGAGGSCFTCGQILQGNHAGTAVYAVSLNSVNRVAFTGVDFTYIANSTAAIHLNTGSINCSIQGCFGPLSGSPKMILADLGTSGSISFNNLGWSKTDNGANTLTS